MEWWRRGRVELPVQEPTYLDLPLYVLSSLISLPFAVEVEAASYVLSFSFSVEEEPDVVVVSPPLEVDVDSFVLSPLSEVESEPDEVFSAT